MIQTTDLSKHYGGGVKAVDGLDLCIRQGEVYGFLGRNGAGKTTTMRMLLGLIRPTSGTAQVMGHAPGDPSGLAQIGAVVEAPAFYPYLSGRDNLRVLARYAGARRETVDETLEEVGLTARAGEKVKGYSMGMRQRLGIAAALLKRPALLLLDEPTNGLDPQGMAAMRTFIRRLGRGDRTVMLSSHLLGEVEQVCNRVGVIEGGRLVAEGAIDELQGTAGIRIRATPVDLAITLAGDLIGAQHVTNRDGMLELTADPNRSAEINRVLVQGGVDVSELTPSERSLEDIFMSLTGASETLS